MFDQAIRGAVVPKCLSSDHEPLYRFHQWQANLRILDVTEIKTVPYVPLSPPLVERLIDTVRRECLGPVALLDRDRFGSEASRLQRLLQKIPHAVGVEWETPVDARPIKSVDLKSYRWKQHCRGLYQTPMAA
jgi:hypothetical protein